MVTWLLVDTLTRQMVTWLLDGNLTSQMISLQTLNISAADFPPNNDGSKVRKPKRCRTASTNMSVSQDLENKFVNHTVCIFANFPQVIHTTCDR